MVRQKAKVNYFSPENILSICVAVCCVIVVVFGIAKAIDLEAQMDKGYTVIQHDDGTIEVWLDK